MNSPEFVEHNAFDELREDLDDAVMYSGSAIDEQTGIECRLKVVVNWNPRRWLTWAAEVPDDQVWHGSDFRNFLLQDGGPLNGYTFAAPVSRWTFGEVSGLVKSGTIVGSRSEPAQYVMVRWMNLMDSMQGERVKIVNEDGSWRIWSGRQIWTIGEWEMELHSRHDIRAVQERLKETSEFAVTHIAKLSRKDGKQFSNQDCQDALFAYQLSASFLAGRLCCPALGKGVGRDGNIVWQEWVPRLIEPFDSGLSWWNGVLADAAGPIRLLGESFLDPRRKTAVQHSIHGYVSASSGGFVEQRIAMAMSTLERLSWQIEVIEGGINADKHDSKPAHKRLRMLLNRCHISLIVPSYLPVLSDFAKDSNRDVAWAVAEVRNRIIHPKHPGDLYDRSGLVAETWLFLLHFLDMVILRWVGYSGEYANRSIANRWYGDVQVVPWES